MIGTIRRHQQWLWVIIITLTIISFIWFFNPAQRGAKGGGGGGMELGGKTISQKMLREAASEVRLLYYLNFRQWPEQDQEHARQINFDVDIEAYQRLFRVLKAEEAGIQIPKETVAEFARRMVGENADFDRFAKELLLPNGLTIDDFERFVRNDLAIQQLSAVVGAAGRLITPAEAEMLWRRDHEEYSGDIVFLNISNYLGKVVITNGALTNFYATRNYRTVDKVSVSYIEIARTNFTDEAEKLFASITNLNQQLRDAYFKKGPNSFKDTNGVVLSETNAIAKMRQSELEREAHRLAAHKANDIARALYDRPLTVENFLQTAASNNLPVHVTPPFELREGPTNLDVSPKFAQIAFSLNASNNPVSIQPIEGEHGFYIIALKEMFPSRPEPFETTTNKVEEEYKRYQAFTLAYYDATNLIAKANAGLAAVGTNGLPLGQTFEEIATREGFKVEMLPPISRATESVTNLDERLDVNRLKSVLLSLEPGKVSGYSPNPPDGGYVVYMRGKLPMDDAKLRAELPAFLAKLRYEKQNLLFNIWFSKQAELAKLPTRPRRSGPN
jgi:hypothetical protein